MADVTTPKLQTRFDFVKQLAVEAGQFAQAYQQRLIDGNLPVTAKGVLDFVSEADQATEHLIRQRLAEAFPDDGFLGEESGASPGKNGTWVVDPIDGTTNFLRQQALWCVSIAYCVDEQPVLGAIYAPVLDELFSAGQGQGAWLNERPLLVHQGSHSEIPLVIIGSSRKAPLEGYLEMIQYLYGHQIEHRRYGTAAICCAHVAAGRFDGYWEGFINAWDVMAGVIILREAGAWVELKPNGKGFSISAGIPALEEVLRR